MSGDDESNGARGGQSPDNLTGVLDAIEAQTDDADQAEIGDVLEGFGSRAFGPLLLVPGLVAVSPLGAVPGAPIVVGVLVVLIAGQRLVGRSHPWVPKKLRERGVEREKLVSAFDKLRPWTKRIDSVIRPRLSVLTQGWMEYAVAALAIGLGVLVPVLGVIPFAAALPGAAILALGLALTANDGVLAIVAFVFTTASTGLVIWTVL